MRQPDVVLDNGNIRLYCGDCLGILPTLEAGSVDAVVTDPPYGIGLTKKIAKQRNGSVKAREGGYVHKDNLEYLSLVTVPATRLCIGLAKRVVITPGSRHAFEYPKPDDMGCWYSAAGTGLGRWGFVCSQPILYYGKCPYLANRRGARPNSCGQVYPNDANKVGHPCAKPLPFATWLVTRASIENETILDPFMGSGTTGVACVKTGRRFIGIELDKGYFDIAVKRIEKALKEREGALVAS